MSEIVYLADGREVPRVCVDALNEYERISPGATFQLARPGIVYAVLEAFKKYESEQPKKKVMINKEDLLTHEPDLISVIMEEMRIRILEDLKKPKDVEEKS